MCERRQLQNTLARAIGTLPKRYLEVASLRARTARAGNHNSAMGFPLVDNLALQLRGLPY
jgi:hypothetical protein